MFYETLSHFGPPLNCFGVTFFLAHELAPHLTFNNGKVHNKCSPKHHLINGWNLKQLKAKEEDALFSFFSTLIP